MLGPQFAENGIRSGDADIGPDQPGFELLQLAFVEDISRLKKVSDIGLQQLLGANEPLFQLVEKSHDAVVSLLNRVL